MTRVHRFLLGDRHLNWALADQMMVSGANFLLGVFLARTLGPQQYGIFVLMFVALYYVNTFQAAIVISPMTSIAPQMDAVSRREYIGANFAIQIGITSLIAVLVAILGATVFRAQTEGNLLATVCLLVATQLHEWMRRYYFIEENARAAFFVDTLCFGGQLAGTVLAFKTISSGVTSALWAGAAAAAAALAAGCANARIAPRWRAAPRNIATGWKASRDYLIAAQFQWAGSQGVIMIGAAFLGASVAGGIRAAQNIVSPINTLYQVMENLVPVRAARKLSQEGQAGLASYLTRIAVIGTAILLPVFVAIAVAGHSLITFAYGPQYAVFGFLMLWQLAYFAVSFYVRQVTYFHRAMQHTSVIAISSALLAAVSIGIAFLVTNSLGAAGVMFALVAGQATGFLLLIAAARKISSS
jgi:O-antigen/teichoic acid export membrane protein